MKRFFRWYLLMLLIASVAVLYITSAINYAASTTSKTLALNEQSTIIIDAGHGGVDGGATSCTGILESNINLQIAIRLDAVFHLLGYKTIMIRRDDISVYKEGSTIAQKKISDLKERVRITNATENAVFISVHQNFFLDSQYRGAQVFYASNSESAYLAELIQKNFCIIDTYNHRKHKKSNGVYLMEHIKCPGVLVECGFLSNPQEEKLLQNADYQKTICGIIASSTAIFLDQRTSN